MQFDVLKCEFGIPKTLITHKKMVKRKLSDSDEIKHCPECQTDLPVSKFYKSAMKPGGYDRLCKECDGIRNKAYTNTRNGAISQIIRGAKGSIKTKNSNGRNISPVTLTRQQFDDLITAYGNRCAYSGLSLSFGNHMDWKVSPERLDNDITYSVANVIPIVAEMNTRLQWSREKALYAATHEDSMDPDTVQKNIDIALCIPNTRVKSQRVERGSNADGVEWCKCNGCGEQKPLIEFHQNTKDGCKMCMATKQKQRNCGWRGCFQLLLRNAKQRGKKAKGFNLTLEFLVNVYKEQQGVCAYSGIPLTTNGDWKMSLERRNVHGGYTTDNVCLIVSEMNSSDRTVQSKTEVVGCGGWSAEKYAFFRDNFQ